MKPVDLFVVDKYVMSQGFEKKKVVKNRQVRFFFFFDNTSKKDRKKKKWVSVETNTNLTTNQLNN